MASSLLQICSVILTFCVILSQTINAVEAGGSKVFNIYSKNADEQKIANTLESRLYATDIWVHGRINVTATTVFVPEDIVPQFHELMNSIPLKYDVFMDNVEEALAAEYDRNIVSREPIPVGKVSFKEYLSHSEINAYLDRLQREYPDLVTLDSRKSAEDRDIKVMKISNGGINKPVFLAEAGIHAREWIAPPTALYLIHQLVENSGVNKDLLDLMDWVIVPVLNVDGYEYSRSSSARQVRMWRKTRSTSTSTLCPGVDGNRNFAFKWLTAGTTSNPCSDTYAGPEPLSEPETKFLADLMSEYKLRAKVYMAIHSYGSYIIHPFSNDGSAPPNIVELKRAANVMAAAIDAAAAVHDPKSIKYTVGTAFEVIKYYASGATDDYALGSVGIPLAFTLELPGTIIGGGFDTPKQNIEPIVKDTWEGFKALARHVTT